MACSGERSRNNFRKVHQMTQKKKRGINKQTKTLTNTETGRYHRTIFFIFGKGITFRRGPYGITDYSVT